MKEAYLYIKKISHSKEILQFALSFFLIVWVIFIATPFDIVASNTEEFTLIPGSSILSNGFFYAALAFLSLVFAHGVICFVFKIHFQKLVFFIAALAMSTWFNSTFLTGRYGEFDGRGNLQIEPFSPLGLIQMGAFFAILIFSIYFRNRSQIFTYTLAIICFISLLTASINISSKLYEPSVSRIEEDNFFTYSKTNPNILMIILDEYQSDYFGEALDNEMKNDLHGFVWFKDAAANFPTTIAAIPAIFSGEIYENDLDIKDFYSDVSSKSIVNKLSDYGFEISYTEPPLQMLKNLFPDKSLVRFNSLDPQYLTTYSDLINYSVFRALPDLFKPYVYNGGEWLIKIRHKTSYDSLGWGWIGTSFKNLSYFADKELIITDGTATFKFHHSVVTHGPTFLGSNCEAIGKVPTTLKTGSAEGKCAMSKIAQIISKLKKADVFDNTMIIITADHGSWYLPPAFSPENEINKNKRYGRVASTLLIKPLENIDSFRISDAPAQLSDIPKTIVTALDMPEIKYLGIDLLSNTIPNNRTRIFNDYSWTPEYFDWTRGVPPITKFEIKGPLKDPRNWRLQ
jgi:hypothetical protein